MTYFLIEHNRRTKRSHITSFKDRDASIRALNTEEAERDGDTDVVLLIAESEADIRITHPRYFWDEVLAPREFSDRDLVADSIAELRAIVDRSSSS